MHSLLINKNSIQLSKNRLTIVINFQVYDVVYDLSTETSNIVFSKTVEKPCMPDVFWNVWISIVRSNLPSLSHIGSSLLGNNNRIGVRIDLVSNRAIHHNPMFSNDSIDKNS